MRHIAFCRYVMSANAYMYKCTCVCHIRTQSLTHVFESYIQVYVDFYIHVSLGGHNMGTFYARKLKFSILLTQI